MQSEERGKLNLLLERHSGDFELVARALQTSPGELKELLAADPWLKGRWLDRTLNVHDRPPLDVPVDAIDDFAPGNPAMPGFKPADALLVEGVENQDRKLKELNWEALGITAPKDRDMLREFEVFVGGRMLRTLDATHGGMLSAFARTSVKYRDLTELLDSIPSHSEAGQVLFDQWAQCGALLLKFNEAANKAGHLRVMMEATAREVEGKKRGKAKPGFARATPVAPYQATGRKETVVTFDPAGKAG